MLGDAFSGPTAEAKGCIKGAIVGGLAGHLAGHGKVGAVAGCIIGHHEANKQDATKADRKTPPSTPQGNRIYATSRLHTRGPQVPAVITGTHYSPHPTILCGATVLHDTVHYRRGATGGPERRAR